MLTFCTNLRKYRLDRGMSQQELADMVGYKSRSSVNKIEKGLTTVTLEQARKIANALNVELEDLVPEYRLIQAPDVSSHDEYKKSLCNCMIVMKMKYIVTYILAPMMWAEHLSNLLLRY